jgi:NAD(P)-dependent dehydrogenase (short-subunit alcohol dehydrogenase family)
VSKSKGFTEADVPDQSGKCFIVTGANTGIGFEISRVLAERGARVLLACRDRAKAEAAMVQIRQATPRADLAFLPLDQADLASVRAAADLAAKEPRIDALSNNAGVMTPPLMRTKQNFELQFGVNHLGTFALTALLLPKLAETRGARVVATSSVAHKGAKIEWDDLNADKGYNRFERYGPRQFGGVRGVSGEASRSAEAQDPALARRLWDVSIAMTEIDPGLPPVA